MSEHDIGKIYEQLNAIRIMAERQEGRMDVLEKKVDAMATTLGSVERNGCWHYPEHTRAAADIASIGARVGTLESDKKAVIATASIVGTFGGWLLGLLGKGG